MSTPLPDTRHRPPGERAKPLRCGSGGLQTVAVAALVAATAAATLVAWQHAEAARRDDQAVRLALAVHDVQTRLEAELGEMAGVIADAHILFSGTDPVSPATFAAFVDEPGRQEAAPYGVGFAQRVRSAEFDPFVTAVRAERGPAFSAGRPPAGAEAAVVLYGGEAFGAQVGFDAMADPERRKALERARDTGRPAVSRRTVLLPGRKGGPNRRETGLVVYSPVYRTAEPRTVHDRRASLTGWTGLPFNPAQVLQEIEAQAPRPLALELAEVGSADPPLARTATGRRPGPAAAMATVDVYGAPWRVAVRPAPGFASGSFDPRLVLAGGLTAAAALAALGLALLRGRAPAGTGTTWDRGLTESEAHLRAAVSSLSDVIVLVDADGTIVFISDQSRPLLGYQPEQLTGRPVEVLIPERAPLHASPPPGRLRGRSPDAFDD